MKMNKHNISFLACGGLAHSNRITRWGRSGQCVNKYRPISAREKRLIAYLSQFQLNIRYLKGTRNYTADCLSRIMDDMNEIEVERWRPSEKMKSEEFILAVNDSDLEKQTRELFTQPT